MDVTWFMGGGAALTRISEQVLLKLPSSLTSNQVDLCGRRGGGLHLPACRARSGGPPRTREDELEPGTRPEHLPPWLRLLCFGLSPISCPCAERRTRPGGRETKRDGCLRCCRKEISLSSAEWLWVCACVCACTRRHARWLEGLSTHCLTYFLFRHNWDTYIYWNVQILNVQFTEFWQMLTAV